MIQGYGIALVCALLASCWAAYRHLKSRIALPFDTFSSIVSGAIIVGVIGGRFAHLITEKERYSSFLDCLAIWQGGLSIAGAIIAVCIYVPYTLKKRSIPLFPAIDIAAIYMALAHAIGRLGCLWAGCCFGCQAFNKLPTSWLAVQYHGHTAGAPTGILLHPAQLYSTISFLCLGALLYFVYTSSNVPLKKPGTIVLLYLIGTSLERFMLDFVRDDRIMGVLPLFSVHQWIALAIGTSASLGLLFVYRSFLSPGFIRHLSENQ